MAEPWEPTMSDVGARIPTRTRPIGPPGADDLLGTFTTETRPTAAQVGVLVPGAVAVVLQAVATVPTALNDLANAAAAWRVAADVELAFPERDGDIDVYTRLDERAKLALSTLVTAAADDGASASALNPRWSFPDPVSWGDEHL